MIRPTLSRRAILAGLTAASPGLAQAAGPLEPASGDPEAAVAAAMSDGASAVLIARGDELLVERYAPGWGQARPREVASVAKSMVAVLIGMAVEDGAFSGFDQSASVFIPAWRDDGRSEITLRHLMSMTSGLDDAGLALRGISGDQFAINAAAPLRDPPGARWAYNTAAYHLLFHILERATAEPFPAWAGRRLLEPLGMDDTTWITGTGVGANGPVTSYYSAASTARDLLRFGSLVHGAGRGLVSAGTMRTLTAPSQDLNPSYGLLWWTNARPGFDATGISRGLRFPGAPADTVAALGAGGQVVVVAPSRGVTLIRQGDPPRRPRWLEDLLAAALDASAGD